MFMFVTALANVKVKVYANVNVDVDVSVPKYTFTSQPSQRFLLYGGTSDKTEWQFSFADWACQ